MPRLSRRFEIFLAILFLGAGSQIVQALLIRESLVVFYGNEISLGAFFGGWLFWIAVGSWLIARWRDTAWVRAARRSLAWLISALPLLVLLQLLAMRSVRLLFDIPSIELIPLGDLLLGQWLIALPSGLALGLAFPLACSALVEDAEGRANVTRSVSSVSQLYVIEAFGALLGGVVFTFVMIQWWGIWRSLGALTAALVIVAWWLDRGGIGRAVFSLLLLAAGLGLATTPLSVQLGKVMEDLRFSTLQPGLQRLASVETRYGHLDIARLGPQTSVIANGRIAESFPRDREAAQTAAYVYSQAAGGTSVLMLGGFAGGLAVELLNYPLRALDVVEQDQSGFDAIRRFLGEDSVAALDDPRLRLHHLDGRRYLNQLADQRFDLVLALDAVPTSAHGNRYFTQEFYAQVKAHLTPDGVICTRVSSASNYLGAEVGGYAGSVFRTLTAVFPHVAIMPGDVHLYCASAAVNRVSENPEELAGRYLALELEEHRFPASAFYSLLPAERIDQVREQLESQSGELNSDARPVTYYLNMILWGRFTASGFVEWLERLRLMGLWPYLIPVAVFLSLWLLRSSLEGFVRPRMQRQAAGFALAVLGFVAMSMQILVLFSYQARVGFMFEKVALLNGLFMAGLALGAGWVGRRLAASAARVGWMSGLLMIVAVVLLALPNLLERLGDLPAPAQESAFLALAAGFGLLTGAGFPLGVYQAERDVRAVSASSGLSEAADSFGGALGGLLTGALLVPLLGVAGTTHLLALLCLGAVLPVLFARRLATRLPVFQERGGRAFPWASLGWLMTFAALTVFGWQWLQRGSEPGPQLQFNETVLAETSGSATFQSDGKLYLGWDAPEPAGPANTASISSMLAAEQVRGYAGPLNLLVSLDREGKLRGVRYVDSDETPSYIEGIGDWLQQLTGRDLSNAALNLSQIDGLSGATLSSQAALEAVNRTARLAGQAVFDRPFAMDETADPSELWTPRFLATLALLLIFIPVYFSASEPARLTFQAVTLLVLGFWLNSLVTEVDLVNLSLGRWSSWDENPQRWLLLGFVLVSGVLLGQVWCGYLCPFGALQEFVSRLGRRLGWRSYPQRALDRRLRFGKFVLLAGMLLAVWISGNTFWATFNPMQQIFSLRWEGWISALALLVLVAALFHYRFWCRYFCPLGAFLALFNKLALLRRFAPKRRFEHCDLGVKEEFDVDCIRCNRCLTGRDTKLKS